MIKFEFTVSDDDAQNIFELFDREMTRLSLCIQKEMVNHAPTSVVEANIGWYVRHQEYLRALKLKMTNQRIIEVGAQQVDGAHSIADAQVFSEL